MLSLALILVGLGFTLTTDAVLASAPTDRAGSASAVSETASRHALPAHAGPAARDSIAAAAAAGELLADPREAFVEAMQTSSLIAAVLLADAAVVAWRVIPSDRAEG